MQKIALLAATLMISACAAPTGSRQAPPLVLPDLAGRSVDLAASRGKPALVVFWATWCDSCREEMPALEAVFRRSGGRFSVIAPSLDEDPAKVPAFAREHRLTFPVLLANRPASNAWGVRMLPTSFLVGPDGAIVRRWVGPLDVRAVENDIVALLDRRPS
jgi:peroxiredoxin